MQAVCQFLQLTLEYQFIDVRQSDGISAAKQIFIFIYCNNLWFSTFFNSIDILNNCYERPTKRN